MAQITSGIHAIFSHPTIYSGFQNILGAKKFRSRFVEEFIKPFSGCAVLDIGCGPADILEHLSNVQYWGFDISELYIEQAIKRFGDKGNFRCALLDEEALESMPSFDIVLLMGVLHHLDDATAINVLNLARRALKPGGRLLSFDPCFEPKQNLIAHLLISLDRGQNVRTRDGYAELVQQVFESPRVTVKHQSWIPYTYCFMESKR